MRLCGGWLRSNDSRPVQALIAMSSHKSIHHWAQSHAHQWFQRIVTVDLAGVSVLSEPLRCIQLCVFDHASAKVYGFVQIFNRSIKKPLHLSWVQSLFRDRPAHLASKVYGFVQNGLGINRSCPPALLAHAGLQG